MSTPTWEPPPGPDDAQRYGRNVPDPFVLPGSDGSANPYSAPDPAEGAYPGLVDPGTGYPGGAYQGGGYPSGGYPGTTPTDPYAGTAHLGSPPAGSPYAGSPYGSPYAEQPYASTPYGSAPYASAPYSGAPYAGAAYPAGPYAGGWVPAPRTEPLAIAALVTSLAGFAVLLSAPVGLGLGIAALRRIRRDGSQGKGMAVGGVVVGAVLTALLCLMVIFWVLFFAAFGTQSGSGSSYSDFSTSTGSGAGTTDAEDQELLPSYTLSIDLAPGDCLAEQPWEYDMSDAVLVDCATTHDTEVLASLELSAPVEEDLLAPDAAYTEALASCTDLATSTLASVGSLDSIGFVDFYYPHPDQWDSGGRSGYCVLVTDDWVTGSALAGTLSAGVASDV